MFLFIKYKSLFALNYHWSSSKVIKIGVKMIIDLHFSLKNLYKIV